MNKITDIGLHKYARNVGDEKSAAMAAAIRELIERCSPDKGHTEGFNLGVKHCLEVANHMLEELGF